MPPNGGPRRKPDYTAERLGQIDQVLSECVSTIRMATGLISTLNNEVLHLKKEMAGLKIQLSQLEGRIPKPRPVFIDETP